MQICIYIYIYIYVCVCVCVRVWVMTSTMIGKQYNVVENFIDCSTSE